MLGNESLVNHEDEPYIVKSPVISTQLEIFDVRDIIEDMPYVDRVIAVSDEGSIQTNDDWVKRFESNLNKSKEIGGVEQSTCNGSVEN